MNTSKKDIIKSALTEPFDHNIASRIVNRDDVTGYMKQQWDQEHNNEPDEDVDHRRIWGKIADEVWNKRTQTRLKRYKTFSVAASIFIIFGIAGAIYLTQREHAPAIVYIASTGTQDMQLITLSDGTKVKLGSTSTLTYPEKFTDSTRTVTLSGQGFFEVAPDPDKPFIVDGSSMKVRALGTSFELFSYEGIGTEETILLTGKVKIDFKYLSKSAILSPNEKLSYNRCDSSVAIEQVDADKYSAWRNHNGLSFENEKLAMIIPRLESWYNVKIRCDEHTAQKYRFTFKIRNESIDRILLFFTTTSKVKAKQIDEDYLLYDSQ